MKSEQLNFTLSRWKKSFIQNWNLTLKQLIRVLFVVKIKACSMLDSSRENLGTWTLNKSHIKVKNLSFYFVIVLIFLQHFGLDPLVNVFKKINVTWICFDMLWTRNILLIWNPPLRNRSRVYCLPHWKSVGGGGGGMAWLKMMIKSTKYYGLVGFLYWAESCHD